jgi:hypothetical protein
VLVPEDAARIDFVPPGNPLDKPVASVTVLSVYPQWIDDTHLGAVSDGAMGIIDVSRLDQGEDAIMAVPNAPQDLGMAVVAVVGLKWATVSFGGNAKHQVITNFGTRPWR